VKIKKVIETPEGNYTFEGEIGPEEHDFLIEAGISFLVRNGIIPFKMQKTPGDLASYVKPTEETQQ